MIADQNIKIAVDAIVFGYTQQQLQILLIKQKYGMLKGQWALVGGFVQNNEGLTKAIERELQEEAGLKVNYLEQLYSFGDAIDRDPRFRVISVAYFALLNSTERLLEAGSDAQEAHWFAIDDLPDLAFDHAEIIRMALQRLRNKLKYQPVGFDLLPDAFLFSDLENLYCLILNQDIDRRNFRKKILSLGLVEETEDFAPKSKGRPAKLYRFNKEKYQQLSKDGFLLDTNFM
jgi:8-oxo-dGTP diphosphatase